MADYVVNPADATTPTNTQGAKQGAEELRALKGYVATLAGLTGYNVFRKNAIIGGDFSTNPWQRGVTFAAAGSGGYTADRWYWAQSGAGVVTIQKTADGPSVAEAGRLFTHCLEIDVTTVDAAIAAGDYYLLQQVVEGYNFLPLAQRVITLSFWVKAKKIGIHCVSIRNSGADRSYIAEYNIVAADTWERKTITFLASPSAGTWNYTTGIGLTVGFALAVGSTFQATAGAWAVGDFYGSVNQVNDLDNTANYLRVCGVQLEAGSNSTPFEQRSFQEELILCQRYYEKSWLQATAPLTANSPGYIIQPTGAAVPTNSLLSQAYFKVMKRVAPTVTISPYVTPANVARVSNGSFADLAASSGVVYTNTEYGFSIRNESGADVTPTAGCILYHFQAAAEL